jgi:hypothetical protein
MCHSRVGCDLEGSFSAQVDAAAWWTRAIDEVRVPELARLPRPEALVNNYLKFTPQHECLRLSGL